MLNQGATDTDIRRVVHDKYALIPGTDVQNDGSSARVAEAFGYTASELAQIPEGSNLGLSCGNPTAMANLREGETVVDLGSGGGLDVFLAARKVGPTGKAIGIDMTMAMIALARRNASKAGLLNAEFFLGEIEHMPLRDNTADCVISNCVINQCPNKDIALQEIYRIVKPGGRLAISDIVLKKELPEEIAHDVYAYVGCVAGAIQTDLYKTKLEAAGFKGMSNVLVVDSHADLSVYSDVDCCSGASKGCGTASASRETPQDSGSTCCGPVQSSKGEETEELRLKMSGFMKNYPINDYLASVKIFATKPLV
ncbi:methyltransferase type 11 [Powellomyces hirtus]|nr:methyltransferase type 11 [Powellomyces hirtus]